MYCLYAAVLNSTGWPEGKIQLLTVISVVSECSCVKVAQSCPTLCDPMDYTVHGNVQARILEWVAFPFSRESSQPGIKPRSPAMQADCLPAEPQRKPKNTPVSRLSLLQQIFLAQELNQGLLHCRRILYQLSYQGISCKWIPTANNHVDRTQKEQLKKLKHIWSSSPGRIFRY